MAGYTRNKKRSSLIFVACNQYLYFGFKPKDLSSFSGVSSEDTTALGHLETSAIPGGGLRIIGAQSPKPPRVKKKLTTANISQQKTLSTYCAYDTIATAQAKGWNLIENKKSTNLSSPSASRKSLTAIAILSNSVRYCFSMNKADFDLFGSELGLITATQLTNEIHRAKLVVGTSQPKPGKASKKLEDGSTFTSFYSDAQESNLANNNWTILSQETVLESGTPFFR